MFGVNKCLLSVPTVLALNSILTMGSLLLDPRLQTHNEISDDVLRLLGIFNNSRLIHLFLSDDLEDQIDSIVEEFIVRKWQTIITRPKTFDTVQNILSSRPDKVIILLYKNYDLQQIVKIQNILKAYTMSWNTEAKVLIIAQMECCYHQSSINNLIKGTLNLFWETNTFKVAVALEHNNTFTLYSSTPFSKLYRTCRNISSHRQIQVIYPNTSELQHGLKISGFEYRHPNKFLGCPMVAHTFPLTPYSVREENEKGEDVYKTGLEVLLVMLLAELYNISTNIQSTPGYETFNGFMATLPNGTKIGIIEDLRAFKIDLGFAGAIPSSDDFQSYKLDLSYTSLFGSISLYVPDPDIIPTWKLVIKTFTLFTWFSLSSTFLLITMLYYLTNLIVPNPEQLPINLTMFAIAVGTTTRLPKLSRIRFLLLAWSIFSLNVTIMFNTKLFSVLTNRPVQKGIKNIKDMKRIGFRLCAQQLYRNFYMNKTDGVMRYLFENALVCDDLDKSVGEFVEKRNYSILAKDDHFGFLVDEKRVRIHQLPTKFITYPVTMYLTKGCVFSRPLNRLVLQVSQSGIVARWLREIRWKEKTKYRSKENACGGNKGVLLNQDDFTWIYIVFVIGLVIAFFSFVVELTFYKE